MLKGEARGTRRTVQDAVRVALNYVEAVDVEELDVRELASEEP